MRKFLFILAMTGALAGLAVPATAKNHGKHATKAISGERCLERVQDAALSPAGTAAANAACTKYATTVNGARAALAAARTTYREQRKAARTQAKAAHAAALALPADQQAAALKAAHAQHKAAKRAARQALRAARHTYHATVKAARRTLRAELAAARTL